MPRIILILIGFLIVMVSGLTIPIGIQDLFFALGTVSLAMAAMFLVECWLVGFASAKKFNSTIASAFLWFSAFSINMIELRMESNDKRVMVVALGWAIFAVGAIFFKHPKWLHMPFAIVQAFNSEIEEAIRK